MHIDYLTKEVGHFQQSLNSLQSVENLAGEVKWPTESTDVVATMIDCLYGREININRDKEKYGQGEETLDFVIECTQFAIRYDCQVMRNDLVRAYQAYIEKTKKWPTMQTIARLDDLGMKDLPLRGLVFYTVAWSVYLSAKKDPYMKSIQNNFLDSFIVGESEDGDVDMTEMAEVTSAQEQGGGKGKKKTGDPSVWYLARDLLSWILFYAGRQMEERQSPLKDVSDFQEPRWAQLQEEDREIAASGV